MDILSGFVVGVIGATVIFSLVTYGTTNVDSSRLSCSKFSETSVTEDGRTFKPCIEYTYKSRYVKD